MSRQDELAKALSELLEEHGSKAVLGALADACEVAAGDKASRLWHRASRLLCSARLFVAAAEKRSDFPLAINMDCLIED